MYWPSTSIDGEYVFKYQDGPWLDPDNILLKYKDWKDISLWPVSSRAKKERKKQVEKQGDPKEKSGIVGAFCRSYFVYEAIDKFLKDIYIPCNIPDRYTYSAGSSSGGLVVYENGNFAFSFHATDPIGEKLCNAFDLVRLHKFGELDNDAPDETLVINLPSFKAMQEFAVKDSDVRKQLTEECLSSATEDFKTNENWMEELEYKKDGILKATIENIRLILENDPNLSKTVGYNEFSHRNELLKDLPWRDKSKGLYWTDTDDSALRHYLERTYNLSHGGKTMDALAVVLEKNRFNPVKEYLNSLVWDGIERIDTLLIDFFDAEDNAYTRAVTRKTIVAAVARIFNPGCKFDYMLLLVGEQGLGKSYFVKKLGKRWFSDSLTTVIGKEAYEQLQGVWIVELGELAATKKADIEALKHFISK